MNNAGHRGCTLPDLEAETNKPMSNLLMSTLKIGYGLLLVCAAFLSVGCRADHEERADFDFCPWDSLKVSLRPPSGTLNPGMRIRCVVIDGRAAGLAEGLHDWDAVEKLRERLGDKVLVRAAGVLEGLKDGSVEKGYYLTPVDPGEWPRFLHGLRFQVREVRIEGRELTFKATLSFGRHQADVLTHDGSRGLNVFAHPTSYDRGTLVRMRSDQVRVVDLGSTGDYIALIEIMDAPVRDAGGKSSK